ncbi:hypothetical protein [Pseudomonas sp. Larv2_ips]|uniref:hypothetical protein n=1 Tax=Pseudomonas sp. Larv2_ips TaxID=1896942 RepID=UPI000E6BFF91|nr:hypothetical protein [Pseudomonas sp. Larv2_ips]
MADSPWDMLSAVGTLAAVVVALGVSFRAGHTSRQSENDRSELAAAKMLSPLAALERKVSYLSAVVGFRCAGTADPEPIFLKCLEDLEGLSYSISMADLYTLLRLPNHSAKRASRALGLIQTLIADARPILKSQSWTVLDTSQSDHHYTRWSSMLDEIASLLIVAVRACEDAASTGAPIPSREEIQGVPTDD